MPSHLLTRPALPQRLLVLPPAVLLLFTALPALAMEAPVDVDARIDQLCGTFHGVAPQGGPEPLTWLEEMKDDPEPFTDRLNERLEPARVEAAAGDPVALRRLLCATGLLGALNHDRALKLLEERASKLRGERLVRQKTLDTFRATLGPKSEPKERDRLRFYMNVLSAFLAVERAAVGSLSEAGDARLAPLLVKWLQGNERHLWHEYVDSLEVTSKGTPEVDEPLMALMKDPKRDRGLRRRLSVYFYGVQGK